MERSTRIKAAIAIATALAIPAEGLRRVAYRDPPGILTVCYGSTTHVQPNKVYSLAECKARLAADMLAAVEAVERCVPGLPVPVLAAFGDAAFNLGPVIVCDPQRSTAARLLKAGRLHEACEQLPRWTYAKVAGVAVELPGLVKRRAAERALCLSGVS